MDSTFATVPGARLWYLDTGGSGIPVVFLHAYTGTSAAFEPQLEPFADAGYRAIAFDRRGVGRTERVDDGTEQPGTLAGDLDAFIEHLGLGPCHIVSIAGGAFAGLDFAAWKPDRVRSLVAGATMASVVEEDFNAVYGRSHIPMLLAHPELYEISAGYRGTNPDGVERWLAIEHGAHRPGEEAQQLRSSNTYAKLASITVPVLAIAGGADLIAPPALMRMWTAHVPDIEFTIFPEVGHAISWEDPELFTATVLEFIGRH